jgi:hypothetical protein
MTPSFSGYNLPQLQDLLSTADQSLTECDGCSRLVSHFLTQQAIQHHCHQGKVVASDGKTIPLHYWIELPDDQDAITWRIDYRLQYWLGANYPHGIFLPKSHHPTYIPVQTDFGGILPQALVDVLLLDFDLSRIAKA